jgi:hypothetical protein
MEADKEEATSTTMARIPSGWSPPQNFENNKRMIDGRQTNVLFALLSQASAGFPMPKPTLANRHTDHRSDVINVWLC